MQLSDVTGMVHKKWTRLMSKRFFKFSRALIAQRRVKSLAIVPDLKVFKDNRTGIRSGIKLFIGTFSFQGSMEAFNHRVVITVTRTAHTDFCSMHFPVISSKHRWYIGCHDQSGAKAARVDAVELRPSSRLFLPDPYLSDLTLPNLLSGAKIDRG